MLREIAFICTLVAGSTLLGESTHLHLGESTHLAGSNLLKSIVKREKVRETIVEQKVFQLLMRSTFLI